jgi:hypothetical protein
VFRDVIAEAPELTAVEREIAIRAARIAQADMVLGLLDEWESATA